MATPQLEAVAVPTLGFETPTLMPFEPNVGGAAGDDLPEEEPGSFSASGVVRNWRPSV